ncbi:MAG: DUF2179 domain-containing protein [Chloroflexota bacterium]
MDFLLSPAAWLGALLIFALRVTDMTFDTLRMLFVVRGSKGIAWVLGFMQSVIFVIAFSSVLSNLDNLLNIVGYAAGFATGNVVGILIEQRLAIGYTHVQIVSSRRGVALAQTLRENGFAVTEIPARGKDGMVSMLSVSVRRKQVAAVEQIVHATDDEAFVTTEDVRPMRRGFWRA